MPEPFKIVFYRQKRRDGALRTGVEINDDTELGRIENEPEETDPVLAWWIDLRCEGRKLPEQTEAARHWLVDHAEIIHQGFKALQDELGAGLDFSTWPLPYELPRSPRGVRIVSACSASRRMDGREIARAIQEIDAHWEELIGSLPVVEPLFR